MLKHYACCAVLAMPWKHSYVALKVYEEHPPDFEIRKGPIVCGAARPYPSNAQATRAGQDICSCDLQPIAENLMANPPGLPARPGVRKV